MLNYVTIEFPLAESPPKRLLSFTLSQERYAHEIAVVKFRDWDVKYSNIRPGEPVRCVIRGKNELREFVGYIHDINPEITPGKSFVKMTLIGASYALKQARQRVFTNVTASQVVEQIAQEYSLQAFVEPHPRVYPQIVQAGQTELQLITRLAKQCGYTFRIQNTSIFFQGLTSEYTSQRSNAKSFIMREANDPAGSTLYSFNLTLGESVRYLDAYKSAAQVGGVEPQDASSVLLTDTRLDTLRDTSRTELFDSYAVDTVAPGYDAAYYESIGVNQRNRFPYRARIEVLGTPSLGPDKPIYLRGIGKDYTGYWVILSARHHIVETNRNILRYTTILEVGADSIGTASVWSDGLVEAPRDVPERILVAGVRNVPVNASSVLVQGSQETANDALTYVTTRALPEEAVTNKATTWRAKVPKSEATVVSDTRVRSLAASNRLESRGVN
jgi:phage protein D